MFQSLLQTAMEKSGIIAAPWQLFKEEHYEIHAGQITHLDGYFLAV